MLHIRINLKYTDFSHKKQSTEKYQCQHSKNQRPNCYNQTVIIRQNM
jgi:hypothetical protein